MKNTTFALLMMIVATVGLNAQTTEFSYQGNLQNSGTASNGNYDFEFRLYDAFAAGGQIGQAWPQNNVLVNGGTFSVTLDFGAGSFPGANRWLEVWVRPTGSGDGFQQLLPRVKLASSPYAIQSLNAVTATTATNATQLGGVAANQYVTTGSASTSYIQNSTTQQPSSDFNIAGTGRANVFSAGTQFNIGNARILSLGGGSTYVGSGAGGANPTGTANTFVGNSAGAGTTTGFRNTFFGSSAGVLNIGGCCNAFFGYSAGNVSTASSNSFFGDRAGVATTTGGNNTFLGRDAGDTNVTGANNTVIGNDADVNAPGLTFATAIGAGSTVTTSNTVALGRGTDTVQVPGNLNVTGAFVGNLPSGSANYIQNTTSPQAASNFNISGNGTVGGTFTAGNVNATTQFNLGGSRVLSAAGTNTFVGLSSGAVTTGSLNAFFGTSAGAANTTGSSNAFFGSLAGAGNMDGASNSFFGRSAGNDNTSGSNNAFFGAFSGDANTTGARNSFFGRSSGSANLGANDNSFFGYNAGIANTSGFNNAFFGSEAGAANTEGEVNTFLGTAAGKGNTTGSENTFVGTSAGITNISGNQNTYIGRSAGRLNDTGNANTFVGYGAGRNVNLGKEGNSDNNTFLGAGADANPTRLFESLNYATAIGAGAVATYSNSITIGRPADATYIHGSLWVSRNARFSDSVHMSGSLRLETLGDSGYYPLCYDNFFLLSECTSSLRHKINVGTFSSGIDLLTRLKPITFDWKQSGKHDFGLGAEDVAAIEPLLVTYNAKGEVEGVKYDRIGVVLINAVKQQQAQIASQKAEIELLKKKVALVDDLRKVLCGYSPSASVCKENK